MSGLEDEKSSTEEIDSVCSSLCEERSSSQEESEETTSTDSPHQRTLPSRTNRGSRMRFLLGNARLIAESKVDKRYERLFSDGDTSDSMNDSDEYNSPSSAASDSFDSDFDDETKGKFSLSLSSGEDNSSEGESKQKRHRKAPKKFRRKLPVSLDNLSPNKFTKEMSHGQSSTESNRASLRDPSFTPERSLYDESHQSNTRIASFEGNIELLVKQRGTNSTGIPVESELPSKAVVEKQRRKRKVVTRPKLTQQELMQNAMSMREHNLALLSSASSFNDDDITASRKNKQSLREKWPFYFYDSSGYRTIEGADLCKKSGSTTLYLFPMGGREYDSLFFRGNSHSRPELEELSRRRFERSIEASPIEKVEKSHTSRYKYHYSHESHNSEGVHMDIKYHVPYPLRVGTKMTEPLKRRNKIISAKSGRLVKPIPTSRLFGCSGPYREPFTGIFYSLPSQYKEIVEALQRIRDFWHFEGFSFAWNTSWGDIHDLKKNRALRWTLLPFLVDTVRCFGHSSEQWLQ